MSYMYTQAYLKLYFLRVYKHPLTYTLGFESFGCEERDNITEIDNVLYIPLYSPRYCV